VTSRDAPTTVVGPLVLADISGYSAFLHDVAYEHRDDAFAGGKVPHAYAVISSLLDGIVSRLVPPFTLSKLEGDAVFAYATNGAGVPRGQALLDCIGACYAGFREQVGTARSVWPCSCEPCRRIDRLELKFVVHAGPFVLQSIAGSHELVGPEVVVAHRLLKSRAADAVGHTAFALVTDAASEWLDVPADGGVPVVEACAPSPPVSGRAFALR
jgi:Protein of unknown function (DUF2652)